MATAKKKPPAKKAAPPPRKGKEDDGPPYVQRHPAVALPIPGDPPPLLRNGGGKDELLRENPFMMVSLDYGAFMWLWRIVEAKALQAHTSPTVKLIAPEQERVALHAATAFREAAGTTQRHLQDLSGGRKRVLKRV